MANAHFRCKAFTVRQEHAAMKVGTDGVLLGAWCFRGSGTTFRSGTPFRMLDIGTGTGLIALMLAQRFPTAEVHAVEIDAAARRDARANFDASPWADRLTLFASSFQDHAAVSPWRYDAVVSNPPFFVDALKPPGQSRARARHADSLSYLDLLGGVIRLLHVRGTFAVILPATESRIFIRQAGERGLLCVRRLDIHPTPGAAVKRVLMEFRFTDSLSEVGFEPEASALVIESEGRHGYSPEYRALTRDFYLHF